jgi:hypothetical protein
MVKKIKYIEQEKSQDELEEEDFRAKLLEYQKSMDWKLWEMHKIAQAWAAREGLIDQAKDVPESSDDTAEYQQIADEIEQIFVDDE